MKKVTTKFQKLGLGCITTITSDVEEMPLLNSRKLVHIGITFTFVKGMTLLKWRRASRAPITIASGTELMSLPTPEYPVMAVFRYE